MKLSKECDCGVRIEFNKKEILSKTTYLKHYDPHITNDGLYYTKLKYKYIKCLACSEDMFIHSNDSDWGKYRKKGEKYILI